MGVAVLLKASFVPVYQIASTEVGNPPSAEGSKSHEAVEPHKKEPCPERQVSITVEESDGKRNEDQDSVDC